MTAVVRRWWGTSSSGVVVGIVVELAVVAGVIYLCLISLAFVGGSREENMAFFHEQCAKFPPVAVSELCCLAAVTPTNGGPRSRPV
jgi:hypothetical protein